MQLMQVYSQKSTSTTLPRNSFIVSGLELIHTFVAKFGAGVRGAISSANAQGAAAKPSARAIRRIVLNSLRNLEDPVMETTFGRCMIN